MSDARPVGFFDSGVGGMCILDAFRRLCPAESTVYIADSANCPYGNRPAEEIVRLSEANVEELLSRGCKAVVVACNTATAAAIDYLRRRYADVPFVGLEPAVKPAALRSRTGVVGVLATEGTFGGRLYNETKEKFARDVVVIATVADEFVALVERGETSGPAAEAAVRARLTPLIDAGCDMIVLGCTHFPHLRPLMEKVAAGRAAILDPSDAVARQARRVLESRGLLAPASNEAVHDFIRHQVEFAENPSRKLT
ncbi:MAG: glutamate racemase [Kiritimatiellae bacterium]|nr:glutamate racemase [Kiritimatiellia bacterium]